ncbi:hypothetical protein [Hymenobacter jeongseonensis]|uniref:hypothetical protein n=1 Tax=Hymenobacter jeongseonensis TaxID=2791027 RepID=UPI0018AFBF73|nr:hypothetical protein [Hymenobacter jeongseonensis]
MPSLLSLPIGELGQRLGPQMPVPHGFIDPVLAPLAKTDERIDSSALFRYQGLSLIASYDYRTGQVSNLLLLGTDEQQLMSSANLQLGDDDYLVLPVFEEHHLSRLLGIRVIATAVGQQAIRY